MLFDRILSVPHNVALYQVNGTGRDSYIANNNGGNTIPTKNSGVVRYGQMNGRAPTDRSLSPPGGSPVKNMHYHPNGQGRDTYISYNSGGQFAVIGKNESIRFVSNLRDY